MRESPAAPAKVSYNVSVTLERKLPGKPHRGKVLAAIQPHCDDIPIFAAGTVLKLIDEGYEGILITVSDDSMAGDGVGNGEVAAKNEIDTREVARRLGLKEAILLKLSKPQFGCLTDCGNASPPGFSLSSLQSRHGHRVRSEWPLRAQPRSLCDCPGSGMGGGNFAP
jgi:LmbE family N-acetylglucosaminyl deacetylase